MRQKIILTNLTFLSPSQFISPPMRCAAFCKQVPLYSCSVRIRLAEEPGLQPTGLAVNPPPPPLLLTQQNFNAIPSTSHTKGVLRIKGKGDKRSSGESEKRGGH